LIVTRTLIATSDALPQIKAICRVAGFIRADCWRRFGALGTVGKSNSDIRKHITAAGWYSSLPIDGTIRAETTKDIINDILTYKAAACDKVKKSIFKCTSDDIERKHLFTALRKDEWLSVPFLHRQMRKHFRHGVSHCNNQFIVRADKHSAIIVDGQLVISVRIAGKYGDDLKLVTRSNGKNVQLKGRNLRLILNADQTISIHYGFEKQAGRACGTAEIGVDKGYTEALVDSDGQSYGAGFGRVMTEYSEQVYRTGRQRNKLHALEKKHRENGNIAKADRIKKNNLGCIKLESRKQRTQAKLRTLVYKGVHQLADKAAMIYSEDLMSPIASKVQWKAYNRKMSMWAKGLLAKSLSEVSEQRNVIHQLVNCAYTSQIDSVTGLLEGKRVADRFYRLNGDVLQADHNAARNVKARASDPEIKRFTPHKEVKRILLSRSSGATERHEAPVKRLSPHERSADKFIGRSEQSL